jgi:hypothetical protein
MAQITVQEFAQELDTTPRQARKFLRSVTPVENQPGKGGRWQIERKSLRSLKKQFATFTEEHTRDAGPEDQVDEAETAATE